MKNPRLSPLVTSAFVMVVLALAIGPARADSRWSWNLSRDRLTGADQTPGSPWTYVHSPDNSSSWLPLGNASSACFSLAWLECKFDPSGALVGHSTLTGTSGGLALVKGIPLLHPGFDRRVAVRWTNPTPFVLDLQILGRVTDLDGGDGGLAGGGGVHYAVVRGNATLATGTVSSSPSFRDSGTFYATISVGANSDILFIVDRFNVNQVDNYQFDTSELDILITGVKTPCQVPCD
jgi:hypothetical protein